MHVSKIFKHMIRNKLKSKGHKIENIKFDEENTEQVMVQQVNCLHFTAVLECSELTVAKCCILEIDPPQDALDYIGELY